MLQAHLQQQQQQQLHQLQQQIDDQSNPILSSGPSSTLPLDLSSTPLIKRPRLESNSPSNLSNVGEKFSENKDEKFQNKQLIENVSISATPSTTGAVIASSITTIPMSRVQCQAQSEEVNAWSVEDVCNFVGSIDICAEYVQVSIDFSFSLMILKD